MIGRSVSRRRRIPVRLDPGEVIAAAHGAGVVLGGARVLDDVTVDVRTGEVLALVGPNGAGKSTLLSVLAGDLAPVSGYAELIGRPPRRWSAAEAAMRRAVLLQQVSLSFPFTVAEVVRMGRSPWAGTEREDEDEQAVAEAMATADVAAFAERRFNTLSGGERARVALARVLAQRAQLVLLDEPTAALDLHHQEMVLGVARRRAAAGDAVVVVLHDLNVAAGYADRIVVLSDGSVAAVGSPQQVFTSGLLSEVYMHEVEVLDHPRASTPIILPRR
ncbi:heme ABC transporter ATP-binding protein [Phytoactinopolyspora halotolerans]|uniref:heme ABC transporter ATP-binding protein n=1 Tax=Phytoactinopolyspora halotolerans TaxID=1981512 RepID=UPI001C2093FD|nr:heme ABC transporter ATP-binding protein [Phytoactinopolyspora halotolerans]